MYMYNPYRLLVMRKCTVYNALQNVWLELNVIIRGGHNNYMYMYCIMHSHTCVYVQCNLMVHVKLHVHNFL